MQVRDSDMNSAVKPTVSRNTTILPKFIGKVFEVYNGNNFTTVLITEEMVGHKFGEFSNTRKRFVFYSHVCQISMNLKMLTVDILFLK